MFEFMGYFSLLQIIYELKTIIVDSKKNNYGQTRKLAKCI